MEQESAMTDNTKMRESFEQYAESNGLCLTPYGNSYLDDETHRLWCVWLSAWQAAQSVPPKPDYSVTQLQRLKALMSELGLATDESLEAFCLDADRQLSRAITAIEKTIKSLLAAQSVPVVGEPVAWGVASKYDGSIWIVVESPQEAERIASDHDDAPIPLYSAPPDTAAELESLRKDAVRYRKLREGNGSCEVITTHYGSPERIDGENLDAVVDAMKERA